MSISSSRWIPPVHFWIEEQRRDSLDGVADVKEPRAVAPCHSGMAWRSTWSRKYGLRESDFFESPMVQDAVIRNLDVVGEAAAALPGWSTGFHARSSVAPLKPDHTVLPSRRSRRFHGERGMRRAITVN
jgi:hypothetical protein